MPTADTFTALGRGNGFPFCPTKVNVSPYDYWSTLGGFKKTDTGDPTQAQIDLSLKNAMKLFWNLNGASATFADTYTAATTVEIDMDAGTYDSISFGSETSNQPPIDRICFEGYESYNKIILSGRFDPVVDLDQRIGIRRLYNGSTSDEDNFIGYGTEGVAFYLTGGEYNVWLFLGSYLYGTNAPGTYQDIFETHVIDGIPFGVRASGYIGDTLSLSSDGTSVTAGADSPSGVYSSSLEFHDMDFYTYT